MYVRDRRFNYPPPSATDRPLDLLVSSSGTVDQNLRDTPTVMTVLAMTPPSKASKP